MGCQCNNQKEEHNTEISKDNENMDDNNEQKDEIFGLSNQDGLDPENLIEVNENENENDNHLSHKNEDKNAKYADYPKKMLELINKIRANPSSYADVVLDGINNIIINQDFDETKPKIIYKQKVKVALSKGEPAFREAAEILKEMQPLPALEFKEEICVPLPETEEELNDHSYLKRQINIIQENNNIDLFFKDLIKLPEVSTLLMIVDDSEKNPGKKRNALLNEEFKYIGISNKFIGKKFIAYFTFSK